MIQPVQFHEHDSIAVIAPHPDDECLGAASALLMAADRTDIYVLTDGSHGNPAKTVEEEAAVRKRQFEAEMEYVRPRSWHGSASRIQSLHRICTPWMSSTFQAILPRRSES